MITRPDRMGRVIATKMFAGSASLKPANYQETVDFERPIGYKKPPLKWKKPVHGIQWRL
jgi:hypothetical protein